LSPAWAGAQAGDGELLLHLFNRHADVAFYSVTFPTLETGDMMMPNTPIQTNFDSRLTHVENTVTRIEDQMAMLVNVKNT
jgi:hypothetical protein